MDILSHGLWAAASAKGVQQKYPTLLRARWAFFWGVFPDLFAFSIPFPVHLYLYLFRGVPESGHPFQALTQLLYSISHSAIIFAVVFIMMTLVRRRVSWVMLAWLLHIAIDIPTHSLDFYPTPVFWPLSDLRYA